MSPRKPIPARPEAANGAALLDELRATLGEYVIFPSEEALDATTLYVAASHAQLLWEHATRLVIKSPLKRCGKSRLEELLAELCHRPLRTANISTAALVRSIDEGDPPTILLDEADTIFAVRRGEVREGAEDLRGILNAGHGRGAPYIRWNMQTRQREECPTFAMAVIAGIGDLPDTIEDRAVVISMRRRALDEVVAPFRRKHIAGLHELRDRVHAWARTSESSEPELPVQDRAADVWEPLVTMGDHAGGSWPKRGRAACEALTATSDAEEMIGERLLADLRDVFDLQDSMEALPTSDIVSALRRMEDAAWNELNGRGLNAHDLARLLRPYGVRPRNVHPSQGPARQLKGYARADLADPWRRYVKPREARDG